MSFKVYLAGSVPKGDKEAAQSVDWRVAYEKELRAVEGLEVLKPDAFKEEDKFLLVVGHDCHAIRGCDLVLVHANGKLGVGTSQEMLIAKYYKKPVVTVLPKDTHHRRTNLEFNGVLIEDWIHPFVFVTSDFIVERVSEAVPWIRAYIDNPSSKRVKDLTVIDQAVQSYVDYVK